MHPHSEILAKNMVLLKIDNKYLYNDSLISFIDEILQAFELSLKNITRIDLACDFNNFKYKCKPAQFIKNFMSGILIKHGKTKYKVMGAQCDKLTYEYLRFGSDTSTFSYYLYNKSLELKVKSNKPWIIQNWEKNFLDIDSDVWRLEFSIKSNLLELMDNTTAETFALNMLEVLKPNNIMLLYIALLEKYWQFSKPCKDTNKSRWPRIEFFDMAHVSQQLIRLSEKKPSNRMDKVFIKKLAELSAELRDTHNENSEFSYSLLKHAIDRTMLNSWAKNNQII